MQYIKEMYEYLAWRLFQAMYRETDFVNTEKNRIDEFVEAARKKLTKDKIKIVDNRIVQMNNTYEELMLDKFREEYHRRSYDEDDNYDFVRPVIAYNQKFYEIWKSAVMKRQTVKLRYDSRTSGITDRLVDPYGSSAPYGEGYCHERKEVRKFRFDRVIDIEIKDNKFQKSKVWKTTNTVSAFEDLENIFK
jgi:hypothetical protein